MKKIILLLILAVCCTSLFAGGGSDINDFVHENTIYYLEIQNPEKAMEALDELLEELNLSNLLGITSIKAQLNNMITNFDLDDLDLSNPLGISIVYMPESRDPINNIMIMLPVKNKKSYKTLEESMDFRKGEVLIHVDDYAILATNEELIKDLPYKNAKNLEIISDRDDQMFTMYIDFSAMTNLMTTLIGEEMQNSSYYGESAEVIDIMFSLLNYMSAQFDETAMYMNINGTEISGDVRVTFAEKSSFEKLITSIPKPGNTKEILNKLPSGYIINSAVNIKSKEINSIAKELIMMVFPDINSDLIDTLYESYDEMDKLLPGPTAMGMNFDFMKYFQAIQTLSAMNFSSERSQGQEYFDIIEMMGLNAITISECSDPAAYRKLYSDALSSDSFKSLMSAMSEDLMEIDFDYVENTTFMGISFDTLTVNMKQQKNTDVEYYYSSLPLFSTNLTMHIADYDGYLYMGIGEGSKNEIIALIKADGKPAPSFMEANEMEKALKYMPNDAIAVEQYSIMGMVNGMIAGLLGSSQNSSSDTGSGITGYMTIDDKVLNFHTEYDLGELSSIISLLGLFMQSGF